MYELSPESNGCAAEQGEQRAALADDEQTEHAPGTILFRRRMRDNWFLFVVGCQHGEHHNLAGAEECAARIISQS